MLRFLSIKNYALIDQLEINFNHGLSIITGETGAGKSILLGALSLILGKRINKSVLKNKTEKCIIEGHFDTKKYALNSFLKKNKINDENFLILKREISSKGQSRSFINDKVISLKLMKDLANQLIDIHSQDQNLILERHIFQLKVVDLVSKHQNLLKKYRKTFTNYQNTKKKLNELIAENEQNQKDLDYYQFQFEQLENADLQENEQEIIEKIKTQLTNFSLLFAENENAILSQLQEGDSLIKKTLKIFPKLKEIENRLESTKIELEDIVQEVENFNNIIEYDKEKIEFLTEKLDTIYQLERKHKVETISELLKIKDDLSKKLNLQDNNDILIENLKKDLILAEKKLLELAEEISQNRKDNIPKIEEKITKQLFQLGILHAQFKIQQKKLNHFTIHGLDDIKFLFSANKKLDLQEVAKVASGGEKSRLMLSIKYLLSKATALPTIIFDEIDVGVSGKIADKMGKIFLEMSKNMQVINITHSPQIASQGDFHYLVFKEDTENATISNIKILNHEEKINEIAQMLSGKYLSNSALQNAKELLKK